MSLLAALLLVQIPVAAPDPILTPSDPTAAFAMFRRLCFDPFPNPALFDAAMAAEGPAFVRWQPVTPMERIIPARVWHSQSATVRYTAGNALARDLPDPQCQVRFGGDPATNVEQLFPALASTLSLGRPRIVGRQSFRTAMWDIARSGQRWRVIFGSQRRDGHLMLTLSMLNLRS